MTATSGSIRFNTDSAKMEIYNGDKWWEIDSIAAISTGAHGVIMGGGSPARDNVVQYIQIETAGNAIDFGDLTTVGGRPSAGASTTRVVRGGGATPTIVNTIDYASINSTGNFSDFGDLTTARNQGGGLSNQVRAVFGGGNPNTDTMDYVTIAITGNAIDFGNLSGNRQSAAGAASPTRAKGFSGFKVSAFRPLVFIISNVAIESSEVK